MEDIEDKLNVYRVKKRRRERVQQIKEKFSKFIMLGVTGEKVDEPSAPIVPLVLESEDDSASLISESDKEEPIDGVDHKSKELSKGDLVLKYVLWLVYLAFWITLFIIAVELQFGIVYLMLSALVFIYLNTRTDPKSQNEISAYSVFNKNCESIDGTLKAEQFEREMGIR